jgi:hypothetical protein
MKKEYDFSKGVRGKFYDSDAVFHLPIYLDPEIVDFFMKIAQERKTNLNAVINAILAKDKEIVELSR